eukprot:CAMPEP_0182589620 /NCGR_PEP_ID=MMETSP1324-20130603/69957_1 /TAXON_ID=236786 /ORGANISM="Florenciella sp., Strain RCC1587" /LENGTH=75 /DNA_ID=CAMNT_0024806769 /DNA_START=36 /DNA_END=259 /DNA_ORIENTATION=+
MKEDLGNSKGAVHVACPKCKALFCGKCGEAEHGSDPCPPPKDMQHWLGGKAGKNTKPCPNCRMALMKNGGCNHMT